MPSEDSNANAAAAIDAARQRSAASQAAMLQGLPAVGPDYVEETHGDAMENAVSTYAYLKHAKRQRPALGSVLGKQRDPL